MTIQYRQSATTFIVNVADGSTVSNDPAAQDRITYGAWLAAGNAPAPFVPMEVSPRQARLALLAAGLLDTVNTLLTTTGGPSLITWEYASSIRRDDPLIASLSAGLGLTSAQIDQLFIQAAAL